MALTPACLAAAATNSSTAATLADKLVASEVSGSCEEVAACEEVASRATKTGKAERRPVLPAETSLSLSVASEKAATTIATTTTTTMGAAKAAIQRDSKMAFPSSAVAGATAHLSATASASTTKTAKADEKKALSETATANLSTTASTSTTKTADKADEKLFSSSETLRPLSEKASEAGVAAAAVSGRPSRGGDGDGDGLGRALRLFLRRVPCPAKAPLYWELDCREALGVALKGKVRKRKRRRRGS